MSDDGGASDLERRLATILSADVAEYSRLMAEDEEQTLRVFRGHAEVFEKLVAQHRGRIFNTAGDAILAEFGSAVEAVRCGTEIQAALRTRNDQLPERRQVQFRIGINLGDVMVQGRDLLGDGVNVAARLQSAAAPGGICISGSVYDQIRNRLSLSFKPLGDMSFKNIPQAVRTFSIIEADEFGVLPAPEPAAAAPRRKWPIWAAAAAVLVVILGGGAYWAYVEVQQRHAARVARDLRLAVEQRAAAEQQAAAAERQFAAAKKAVVDAQARAAAERAAAEKAAAVPAAATVPARNPSDDGVYGGPICFAAAPNDQARCFHAQAVLQDGRLAGEWPGRDPEVTMHLAGDVSAASHVTIHIHGERTGGARVVVIDFTGNLKDGALDATGEFANGRNATLNWRRSGPVPAAATSSAAAPAPAAPAPRTTAAAVNPPANEPDGNYAGQVCLGPGPNDQARCFRAQAALRQGKLSGDWPGRDPNIKVHLEGEVTPSGAATFSIRSVRPNGSQAGILNFTGTLRDGRLDATGGAPNGRTASLNWRKN